MPYYITIYDWSLYTLLPAIPMADIEGDTHSNDPASPDYSPTAPSWIGETFTYNGGSSTLLEINDDDLDFEDGYVETGGTQTLAQDVTINGTTYLAGSVVENEFSMLDASGNEVWIVRIDGINVVCGWQESPTRKCRFLAARARRISFATGRQNPRYNAADKAVVRAPRSEIASGNGWVWGNRPDAIADKVHQPQKQLGCSLTENTRQCQGSFPSVERIYMERGRAVGHQPPRLLHQNCHRRK